MLRTGLLVLLVACSHSVSEDEVVDDLRDQPPAARAARAAKADGPENTALSKRGDVPLTVVGNTLDVGDPLPDVTLLGRSVWVIGADGEIADRQIVEDQGTEPDYDALVAAANKATGA